MRAGPGFEMRGLPDTSRVFRPYTVILNCFAGYNSMIFVFAGPIGDEQEQHDFRGQEILRPRAAQK
jgi:hypothetical protein